MFYILSLRAFQQSIPIRQTGNTVKAMLETQREKGGTSQVVYVNSTTPTGPVPRQIVPNQASGVRPINTTFSHVIDLTDDDEKKSPEKQVVKTLITTSSVGTRPVTLVSASQGQVVNAIRPGQFVSFPGQQIQTGARPMLIQQISNQPNKPTTVSYIPVNQQPQKAVMTLVQGATPVRGTIMATNMAPQLRPGQPMMAIQRLPVPGTSGAQVQLVSRPPPPLQSAPNLQVRTGLASGTPQQQVGLSLMCMYGVQQSVK